MKPITPDEALEYKRGKIPEYVYEAFNELIKNTYTGTQSFFWQNEVVDKILENNQTISRNDIFDNGYLDVGHAYEKAGWTVTYDDGHSGKYFKFYRN